MAMKRKAPTGYRRKIAAKRRRYARKIPRNIRYPLLKLQRTTYLENWVPNTTTVTGFWKLYTFTLNNLNNASEYINLFDQYRICALKYTFVPRYDSFDGADTTDTTLPGVTNQGATRLHIVNDPFTTRSPSGLYTQANLNSFFEEGRVKTYSGNRNVNVYFKTAVNNSVDSGANRTRSMWLNVSQSGVPHYGFHVFAQDVNMTGVFGQSWDVFVTSYIMFKNMR